MSNELSQRIARVRTELRSHAVDAMLVSNMVNLVYLTGFRDLLGHEREATLLITLDRALLYLPRMYAEQGEGLESVRSGLVELRVDQERDRLLSLFSTDLAPSAVLGLEADDLTHSEYQNVSSLRSTPAIALTGVIQGLRQIKDSSELESIRKAAAVTDKTWIEVIGALRTCDYTALSELDLVEMCRKISSALGGEGFGFDPIVACGAGAAQPHYRPSARKLVQGQALLIDMGIRYQGYTGDLTRTIFLGTPTEKFSTVYAAVLDANQRAIAACRAGVRCADVDSVARKSLAQQGLDQYFVHGTGHALGLEIHEPPKLRAGVETALEAGMTVTIEPGVYLSGEFGLRIEDLVLITQAGCEIVSTAAKTLTWL